MPYHRDVPLFYRKRDPTPLLCGGAALSTALVTAPLLARHPRCQLAEVIERPDAVDLRVHEVAGWVQGFTDAPPPSSSFALLSGLDEVLVFCGLGALLVALPCAVAGFEVWRRDDLGRLGERRATCGFVAAMLTLLSFAGAAELTVGRGAHADYWARTCASLPQPASAVAARETGATSLTAMR